MSDDAYRASPAQATGEVEARVWQEAARYMRTWQPANGPAFGHVATIFEGNAEYARARSAAPAPPAKTETPAPKPPCATCGGSRWIPNNTPPFRADCPTCTVSP